MPLVNGFIESVNGKLRDECPNANRFLSDVPLLYVLRDDLEHPVRFRMRPHYSPSASPTWERAVTRFGARTEALGRRPAPPARPQMARRSPALEWQEAGALPVVTTTGRR